MLLPNLECHLFTQNHLYVCICNVCTDVYWDHLRHRMYQCTYIVRTVATNLNTIFSSIFLHLSVCVINMLCVFCIIITYWSRTAQLHISKSFRQSPWTQQTTRLCVVSFRFCRTNINVFFSLPSTYFPIFFMFMY